MVNDPYQVLGVSRNATQEEIKKAYRQKARLYHPDTHPNDPEANRKMNEINEAYDMLTHPEKYAGRQQYGGYGGSGYGSSGYGNSGYGSSGYGNSGYGSSGYGNSGYGSSGSQNSGYQQNGYNNSYGGPYGWSGNFDDFFSTFGSMFGQEPVNINPQPEPGDSQEIRQVINYINSGHYTAALQMLSSMTSDKRNARWHYLCSIAYYGNNDISHAADFIQRAVRMDPNNRTYQTLYSYFMRAGRTASQEDGSAYYSGRSYGGFSLRRILLPIIIIVLFNWFLFGGGCFGCYGRRGCYGNYGYPGYSYNQEEEERSDVLQFPLQDKVMNAIDPDPSDEFGGLNRNGGN